MQQVDPIDFAGDEPTDFSGFTSASVEDEQEPSLFIYIALFHAWKRLVRKFKTRHIPDPFKEHA